MAKVAQEFNQDYQEFQTIETTTKKILESVARFEADLGIIYLDDENKHILESSWNTMIWNLRLWVIFQHVFFLDAITHWHIRMSFLKAT